MFYGGIDIAKRRHEVCILDESGNKVIQMHVDNSQKGFNSLLQKIRDISPLQFCMEATGHYWLSMYCHLAEQGHQVHVVNPIQSDALRKVYIRKTKTDRKDAFLIADLLRLGRAPKTEMPSETEMKLQALSRTRFGLVKQVAGLKTQVIGILDRIFPEYSQCFSDVFIKTSRELLKNYPEPEDIVDLDLSELTDFLHKHSRGVLGMDRAQKVQEMARQSFGIKIALDAFTLQLRLLIEQIEFCQEQISVIEEAIDQVMEEFRPSPDANYRHVVETPPGIGTTTAAAIIGEIRNINRFPNAKSLVAFAGLDATVNESGEFKASRNKISKRGSPTLRHSLYLAAISSINANPELEEYYRKKRSQGKSHKMAVVAVARRLLHLLYSLWKDNRSFDPDYKWAPPQHAN